MGYVKYNRIPVEFNYVFSLQEKCSSSCNYRNFQFAEIACFFTAATARVGAYRSAPGVGIIA